MQMSLSSSLRPIALRSTNRLLDALPDQDRQQFLGYCQRVELSFSHILCEQGKPVDHAYFPLDSFISLATPVDGHASIEVGLVGNEGMLGTHLVLGVAISPLLAQVQGSGEALRIEASALQDAISQMPSLHVELNRYIYVLLCQLTRTAVCNRFHTIAARLARWLLMTQDRAHSDHFHLTHEFLAYMLGVRRAGVSTAANTLQQQGLISYRRGNITILNREGLEASACSCYGTIKTLYERVLYDRTAYPPVPGRVVHAPTGIRPVQS
jgi:CRP-like cAMP-binding protein